jgi:hypothetical protein
LELRGREALWIDEYVDLEGAVPVAGGPAGRHGVCGALRCLHLGAWPSRATRRALVALAAGPRATPRATRGAPLARTSKNAKHDASQCSKVSLKKWEAARG